MAPFLKLLLCEINSSRCQTCFLLELTIFISPSPPPTKKYQESTDAAKVQEFVLKHALPLVGHRTTSNDAKRYTKKPLIVVYFTVDFSFDYRVGKYNLRSWHFKNLIKDKSRIL